MKVGIITYHRTQNYGAQLQAWALQTFVASLGYDVDVIDYWPKYHDSIYHHKYFDRETFLAKSIPSKFKYAFWVLAMNLLSLLRHLRCVIFAKRHLNLSASTDYDRIIYGSDQIWRKQHLPGCESFNPVYFGEGDYQTAKRISYAASMGPIEANNPEDIAFINSHLSKFFALSTREKDLQQFLADKASLQASLVCDPVFLLSSNEWKSLANLRDYSSKNHILLYNLCNIPEVESRATELSKQTGLRIIRYSGQVTKFPSNINNKVAKGPIDFIRDLYSADYVVTSSFHGVALSLVFSKPFFYASQSELSGRVMQLLSEIGAPTADMLNCEYSADMISSLSQMSERSKKWLSDSLAFQYEQ